MCKWHMFDHFRSRSGCNSRYIFHRTFFAWIQQMQCQGLASQHSQKTPRVDGNASANHLPPCLDLWRWFQLPSNSSNYIRCRFRERFTNPSHWKHHQSQDQNTGDEAEEKVIISLPDTWATRKKDDRLHKHPQGIIIPPPYNFWQWK